MDKDPRTSSCLVKLIYLWCQKGFHSASGEWASNSWGYSPFFLPFFSGEKLFLKYKYYQWDHGPSKSMLIFYCIYFRFALLKHLIAFRSSWRSAHQHIPSLVTWKPGVLVMNIFDMVFGEESAASQANHGVSMGYFDPLQFFLSIDLPKWLYPIGKSTSRPNFLGSMIDLPSWEITIGPTGSCWPWKIVRQKEWWRVPWRNSKPCGPWCDKKWARELQRP